MRTTTCWVAAIALLGCNSAARTATKASATTWENPIVLEGAPTCEEAAAALGLTGTFTQVFIPEPWSQDVWTIDGAGNQITFAFTTPQKVFDWNATIPIDFILVRGETSGTQAYVYDPSVESDTGLRAPQEDVVTYVKLCFEQPQEEQGCTLTQGYWKTHSKYGPAPLDGTWAQLDEDTAFFLSGKTYYQVLWTPPKGNAYYILAHQYVAARLNALAGASTDAVADALDAAKALFESTAPADANANQTAFLQLAAELAEYNEGATGPGHCGGEAVPE